MANSLDMALDDVIGSSRGNKGGGKQSKGWSKGKGKRERVVKSVDKLDADAKLDKSLDDIVELSFRKSSKGKGSDKGKGKGKKWIEEEDFGGNGWKGSGKNYSKGKGKSSFKGKNWSGDYRPAWVEREDYYEDGKGSKGKFGKGGGRRDMGSGPWSGHDDRVPSRDSDFGSDGRGGRDDDRGARASFGFSSKELQRRLGKPVAKVATSNGGFLRIEQEDDDDEADSPAPPRRRGVEQRVARAMGNRSAAAPAAKRGRARDEDEEPRPRAKAAKLSSTKRIKVTNIPKELKARDVREAFESETGPAASCELSKGTAHIEFRKASDAVKAVEAFHKGELNGKIIQVVLVEE